jgi:putative flippase GtrA
LRAKRGCPCASYAVYDARLASVERDLANAPGRSDAVRGQLPRCDKGAGVRMNTRLDHLRHEMLRLFRFGLTGVVATTVYATVSLLAIEAFGAAPIAGSILGYATAIGVSFYGHSLFSFRVGLDHGTALRRFLVLAAASFVLSTMLMWLIADIMGLSPRIAVAVIAVVIPINNYVCNRFWVFREGLSPASDRAAL